MRLSACVALLCFVAHASSNPQALNFPVWKSRHEWKCFRASLAAWGTFSRGSPDRGETGATTCEIFFLNFNTCISHNIQYFSIYSVLIVCSVCSQYCDQPSAYRLTIYCYANIVWFSKYCWNIVITFFFGHITRYLIMKYWSILAFHGPVKA